MHTQEVSEVRQIIQELCLMNNRFMNKVFENNIPAAELLLRIILKNDKIKVREVNVQSFIQNLYGHSAQMDILAQDEDGEYFNVEVQRSDEGAPAKRARFYSSMLDIKLLTAGKPYEALPVTYVIFITENDVLHGNLPVYDIDRQIRQTGTDFGDDAHIVYVNSKIQDATPLGRLMQDFYCKDPAQMHYKELAERSSYLKNPKEGEVDMQDIIELYAEKKAKEAAKKATEAAKKAAKEATKEVEVQKDKEYVCKLLKRGISVDKVADLLEMLKARVVALAEK